MNTKIYLENYELDLTEDVVIPLNKQLLDITEVGARLTEFTKTVKIKGTTKNNLIFNNFWDPRVQSDAPIGTSKLFYNFNPRKKVAARIKFYDSDVINGYLQLLSIERNGDEIYYDCVIFGTLGNLIQGLGDKKLNELPSTALDHTFSVANVVSSFATGLAETTDYSYPIADYGFENIFSHSKVPVTGLHPAIRLNWLVKEIIAESGYSFDSNIIDTTDFKKIWIPYMGTGANSLTAAQIASYSFTQQQPTSIVAAFPDLSTGRIDYGATGIITGSSNFTGSQYIASFTGGHSFTSKLVIALTPNIDSPGLSDAIQEDMMKIKIGYEVRNSSNAIVTRFARSKSIKTTFNNTVKSDADADDSGFIDITFGDAVVNVSDGVVYANLIAEMELVDLNLQVGDKVKIFVDLYSLIQDSDRFYDSFALTTKSGTMDCQIYSGATSSMIPSSRIVEGTAMNLLNMLPNTVTMKDFLLSFMRTFNLVVVEMEPENGDLVNKVGIYTRDYYMALGEEKDFTYKMDYSLPISIVPVSDNNIQKYLFTWKEAPDFYNVQYKALKDYDFGHYEAESLSEFGSETYTPSIIFEPQQVVRVENFNVAVTITSTFDNTQFTIEGTTNASEFTGVGQKISILGQSKTIVKIKGNVITIDSTISPWASETRYYDCTIINTFDRHQMSFYKSGNDNQTRDVVATNPRLVIYSGSESCTGYYITGNTDSSIRYTYPYFSHLDDKDSPTFDMNWGEPTLLNFPLAAAYPTANLYSDYHKETIIELAGNNSKILTAYFNLNPLDIISLKYNDIIFIDGTRFRFSKVVDYDLNSSESIKLELFQINT